MKTATPAGTSRKKLKTKAITRASVVAPNSAFHKEPGMNLIDSKQVMAMAEYASDRAKAKLDDAIDREESRDELIAARTQELVLQRMAEMKPIDIVAGMQSITERGGAPLIAKALLEGDLQTVGVYIRAAIGLYIEQDSEVIAHDWMDRIERELAQWGH